MAIFLKPDLTTRLVRERYGSFDALVDEWEAVAAARSVFPKPKHRASIYRWVSDGVPTRGRGAHLQIFGLCALLEVDLLTIFDYERNGYFSKFAKLRQFIYTTGLSPDGLKTFMEMYKPGDNWPSDAIAQACYGRRWFGSQFTNADASQSTDYMLVQACFSDRAGRQPRAVHVAYRRVGVPDTMWRYYGTVIAVEGQLELYNESGGHQQMAQVDENVIAFRTYYGGRAVEWRVASLHDFALKFQFPFNDMTTIGFNW